VRFIHQYRRERLFRQPWTQDHFSDLRTRRNRTRSAAVTATNTVADVTVTDPEQAGLLFTTSGQRRESALI